VIWSIWSEIAGLDVFWDVAIGGGEVPVVHAGNAFDGIRLAELLDLGPVEAGVADVAGLIEKAELDHAVGVRIGKGIDEDGVNDGEDGACGANAESEREDGGEDEAGAFAKFTGGVLEAE
jgi:hypothetical protein